MKAQKFDTSFDHGEDVMAALDLDRAHRLGHEQRRVVVDFPV